MAILTLVLASLAALLAVPIGGLYVVLGLTAWRSPGSDSPKLGAALLLAAALNLGGAGLACWRAFHGTGGLIPALVALALSALMAWAAAGMAHGIANP